MKLDYYLFMWAAATAVFASPVTAQTTEDIPGDGTSEVDAVDAARPGRGETVELEPPSLTIQFKFAPVIAGNAPLEDEERLTDYQTNSLSSTVTLPLLAGPRTGLGLSFSGEAGVKHNLDFDEDSVDDDDFTTALYGNGKLEWARGVWRLSPFIGYGIEQGYLGFLEDRGYRDHKLSVGAGLQTSRYVTPAGVESMSFGFTARIERTWSILEARERWTPSVAAELRGGFPSSIGWQLLVSAEYRIFDEINNASRRDWRLNSFAGIDLARVVDNSRSVIRELKIGVRWTLNESNVDEKDFSNFNLLPIVTIGTVFR